ncbi:accessory Sec system translocase SecA2 [Brevibacterium marinum]|uniref:Protein translocase subunit SecA n=1 Tax=Brevibacterium marinum TaxID=418643 RepID=A0A846S1Q5_9MICO|nr:accessory Sec system translocase SecA2 [Brevibacterium marinum]NJC57430.1 preprotein translocase subunit SecA [Brevibacterium marinum]
MGFFSRLLNRPGAQADKATGWFDRAADDLAAASREFAELDDRDLTEAAAEIFTTGSVQDNLVRYCALAREAADRVLDERAYDTQLKGLVGLLQASVVQMATGEGKTLVGALAAAGYALQGRRVHVVSVNDYLAVRDRTWMKPVFDLLGVQSASISGAQTEAERREAYGAEVLYASVTEVGFDVLRDRFVTDDDQIRIPDRDVVIVDEADSVLIDEARVPLVLAGSASVEDANAQIAVLVETLSPDIDYEISQDHQAVSLTDAGINRVEAELGVELFGEDASELAAVNLALYAKSLVKRDVDYLIVDGRVKLISASRGRVAELQRWPDGLQAAVEAKEGVGTTESGEILDQMTVEELIHGYETVCGMTGTALAVGDDLREFYNLEIVPVDTHLPVIRSDEPDRLYTYQESKERAIVEEVADNHAKDRPVLIGTSSVAESESLAARLVDRGIEVKVLNAKDDSLEAEIIAAAGAPGAVTVSTQMAGRGTDIRLADASVADAGGLLVIGAGRYLSSRLDDQLRGRAGRQGDPGTSVFFTSLEDELLTRVPEIQRFVSEGDETGWIESKRALGLVEHAQRISEGQNTALHRDTWKFNELMAKQRELVLTRRRELRTDDAAIDELKDRLSEVAANLAEEHPQDLVDSTLREVMLFHLDARWVDHLAFLNDLREGIHLRTFAREKPHEAFNAESIRIFSSFWSDVVEDSASTVEEAEFTDTGIDLASHGLKRPSSTWTYLTTESAFGSDIENIVKKVKR